MSLGERLAALRIKQGLSQGELAEKMDVSRQSVSKWETDASIPELDKLVALSELFQISLDELIKGASSQPCSQAAENSSPTPGSQNPSGKACARTTGWGLLLGAGLLCCAAGILLLDIPGLLGIYFVLCGILCARVRSYLVLTLAWLTVIPLMFLSADLQIIFGQRASAAALCAVWGFVLVSAAASFWAMHQGRKNKK